MKIDGRTIKQYIREQIDCGKGRLYFTNKFLNVVDRKVE